MKRPGVTKAVWIADVPLDVNDMSRNDEWVLALDVPDEWLDEQYEIVPEERTTYPAGPGAYGEWRLPAEMLNKLPITVSAHRDDNRFNEVINRRWRR